MIPQNQTMQEVLNRLQKLEVEVFEGETFETNYGKLPPREQAKRISEGKDEPHHIGKKSKEVLIVEIYSLLNLKEAFRPPWEKFKKQILDNWAELAEIVGDTRADSEVKAVYQYLADKQAEIAKAINERKDD